MSAVIHQPSNNTFAERALSFKRKDPQIVGLELVESAEGAILFGWSIALNKVIAYGVVDRILTAAELEWRKQWLEREALTREALRGAPINAAALGLFATHAEYAAHEEYKQVGFGLPLIIQVLRPE